LDITQLKYFITIAQTMNFSEAARRYGISQPSISHGIGELEKQLGAPLFIRSRRGVTMTDAGRELLPAALEIVDTAEKAALRIRQLQKGECGSISISALTTASAVLSKCISEFSKRHPGITPDICFTSARDQTISMNDKRFDFHFALREMVPAGEEFESIFSHSGHLCIVFPADHPLAHEPLDFKRLKDEKFIGISELDGPTLYNDIMHVCGKHGYKPNIVCKYDRAEAVLLSVGAGLGISIIPEEICRVFYSENVAYTRIPDEEAVRTYVVAWHRNMTNPSAKLFLDVVKDVFGSR